MTGFIGTVASTRIALTTEITLSNLVFVCTGERSTKVVQFFNPFRTTFNKEFDGILVTQIVTTFYGIEDMVLNRIFFGYVVQHAVNTALSHGRG